LSAKVGEPWGTNKTFLKFCIQKVGGEPIM